MQDIVLLLKLLINYYYLLLQEETRDQEVVDSNRYFSDSLINYYYLFSTYKGTANLNITINRLKFCELNAFQMYWVSGHLRSRIFTSLEADRTVCARRSDICFRHSFLRSGVSGFSAQQGNWTVFRHLSGNHKIVFVSDVKCFATKNRIFNFS